MISKVIELDIAPCCSTMALASSSIHKIYAGVEVLVREHGLVSLLSRQVKSRSNLQHFQYSVWGLLLVQQSLSEFPYVSKSPKVICDVPNQTPS